MKGKSDDRNKKEAFLEAHEREGNKKLQYETFDTLEEN